MSATDFCEHDVSLAESSGRAGFERNFVEESGQDEFEEAESGSTASILWAPHPRQQLREEHVQRTRIQRLA